MKTKTTKIEKSYTDKKTGEKKSISIEYAKVADRLQEFRANCPNGKIETKLEIKDAYIFATAFVKKDLSKIDSAEATGNAVAKLTGYEKEFEKLETLSVGRALAFLGYGASGEIASSEEMEEFQNYQEELKEKIIINLQETSDLAELQRVWNGLSGAQKADDKISACKEELKKKYSKDTLSMARDYVGINK